MNVNHLVKLVRNGNCAISINVFSPKEQEMLKWNGIDIERLLKLSVFNLGQIFPISVVKKIVNTLNKYGVMLDE